MFRRNFATKSASAIKSSEWRRIRERLPVGLAPHLSSVAKVSAERITFATDKAVATLYWSVPDNQLVAMDPGTVIEENNVILPSLIACWAVPGGIPTFCTPPQVMEKIFQAADLMAPGIFGDLPSVQPGQIVGVALLGNPRCVLAIGIALMDTHTIATQRKGKAVRIIHFYGDNLWEKCGKPKVPEIAPVSDEAAPATQQDEPLDEPRPADESTASKLSNSADPTDDPADDPADDQLAATMGALDMADSANPATEPAGGETPALDPDGATQRAFLYGLLDMTSLPPADFANLLPIAGSTFHSRFMQPYAKHVDMKATKWKKLAKFLKAMEKEFGAGGGGGTRLVAVKEIRGGEMQITAVNAGHAALKSAKAQRDEDVSLQGVGGSKKKVASGNNPSERPATGDASSLRMSVTPLFQPIASLAFLFPDSPRDALFTRTQVTQALDEYIDQHDLANPKNRRLVRVDDNLTKYTPKPKPPMPEPASSSSTSKRGDSGRSSRPAWEEEEERNRPPLAHYAERDKVLAGVLGAMRKNYRLVDPRSGTDEVRRGEFHKIEISTEKRQGRKVVTVVKYLAQVMPGLAATGSGAAAAGNEIQSELSAKCASAVSVGDMPGVPSALGPVVQVQGDQIKFFRTWVADKGIAHLSDFVGK